MNISSSHSDSDYYKLFNLTPKEIAYVESALNPPAKKKSSKKSPESKSKQRIKDLEEVYTPRELVLQMLDMVSKCEWEDKNATYIDPACGNGNFLLEILIKRLNSGVDIDHTLNTLYGIDIMHDNIKDCHDRILGYLNENNIKYNKKQVEKILQKNIVVGNSLQNKMQDIF